uniref:protein-tyrosine-phosphatase n=1 Tax=Scophthalmus maximus TaxID=52904 RepID=A0A8D3BGN3_SCOMX
MEEQQAWILRGFLLQLETQEAADEEAPNGFAGEFARLKIQSTRYRMEKTFPTKTAEKQDNIKKNRYKDIVPFDHSRVRLTLTTAENDTDYINASFIEGESGPRAYIATQGPLPHTVLDFLRMLWEYDVKVVVMACREFEMAKKKSERYWPQKQEQPFVCEPFTVYCDSEENKGDYLTRMLRLTHRNCSRTLTQLHYVNWPDHGVPDAIPPILEMLQEMRSYQDHGDVPICIHCSAGCGRTGALCAIDYTWNLLKKQMITPDFNIYDLVKNMRTQRPSVVQTKEQYELVYRTIKLLFQRHLQSMDAQKCKNEVTMVPCAVTPGAGYKLLDPSPELVLLPKLRHLRDEEREDAPPPPPPPPHPPLPQASELLALQANDAPMERQQGHLLRASPDTAVTSQVLQQQGPRTSPALVHASQGAAAARESESVPSPNPLPSPAVAEAMCAMVEDPYFDTSMSSPSPEAVPADSTEDTNQPTVGPVFGAPSPPLNDRTPRHIPRGSDAAEAHADEEAPPPLPERTPESYVLAVDTDPSDRLSVIIPPNAAAEAVRGFGGSPPSPVPPLPERTPESFELDVDQAPAEHIVKVRPVVILNRIGTSSEWSGYSEPAAGAAQRETTPWVRSKSQKVKMTFTAADSPTPSLPDRTPESFILKADTTAPEETSAFCLPPMETRRASPRAGRSHEWDGNSQPKKFLDVVMSRSKSVRAKGSRQEPLTAAWQLAPPTVVVTGAGSAQAEQHDVNCGPSLGAETPGNNAGRGHEKGMSRTRSLKFFRHKQKSPVAPPPLLNQPAAPPPTSSSLFNFGFGNRFRKPKGPRSYPESWF